MTADLEGATFSLLMVSQVCRVMRRMKLCCGCVGVTMGRGNGYVVCIRGYLYVLGWLWNVAHEKIKGCGGGD